MSDLTLVGEFSRAWRRFSSSWRISHNESRMGRVVSGLPAESGDVARRHAETGPGAARVPVPGVCARNR